ncbi:MAG: GAF domain-containing SpoIIE family protein phosphatase [Verrucomicrobiae bacterium]|nr:GAF domain-containing SpoIIE family protein phosphatase [Verrucomicrobiae bacterium]
MLVKFFMVFFFLAAFGLAYLLRRKGEQNRRLDASRRELIKERKIILEFLHDLGDACTESINSAELLKSIAHFSNRATEAKSSAIFMLNKKERTLRAVIVDGAFPPPYLPENFVMPKVVSKADHFEQIIRNIEIPVGAGIIGEVAQKREAVLLTHGHSDPRVPHFPEGQLTEALNIDTMMAVPLRFRNELLGVMAVVNKKTASTFTRNDLDLFSSMADQASYAIHNATLYTALAEKKRFDRDLRIASDIQRILLPDGAPVIRGFDLFGDNIPALEVGGDYYDFIQVSETKVGIAIADVSGKGVPGAMIMAIFRSVLRSEALRTDSPAEVLRNINRLVFNDIKEDMFISASYAVLDTITRNLTYARAGHEPPLLCHTGSHKVEPLESPGMAVGIDNGEIFDTVIEDRTFTLRKGDAVLFYTDGATEAQDSLETEFGRDDLVDAFKSASNENAKTTVENITERLNRFVGEHPRYDDITLIVLKVTE